jgi:hypothetical protein
MFTFIKRTFIFALILIGVFSLLNWLQTNFNTDPVHYKNQYAAAINTQTKIDGIIIGTSHATHSLRPKLLAQSGINFFNFALNGSNPEINFQWYNEIYLSNSAKPKYCIFTIDFFMFDEKWLWRRFEQDSEYFPKAVFFKQLIQLKPTTTDLIVNRFPFLKYRSQLKSSLKLKQGNLYFNEVNYDRGYISCSSLPDSNKYKAILKFNIDKTQINYFKALVKQMLADGVQLFFVMTPEYGISVKDYQKMESLKIIEQLADQYKIPFLNYNTTLRSNLNQDSLYFTDWGHMNHFGAGVFSKQIASELKVKISKKTTKKGER